MHTLHAILRWFCIEGRDRKLSLTTIAFAVAMYCLISGKPISLPELGAFLVAVVAHRSRQNSETKLKIAGVPPEAT